MHHFFTKIRNHQTVPVRQKRWRLYRLADFVVQMVAPCLIPTCMMNLFLGKNCIILNACFHQRQSQTRGNNQKCGRIRSGKWKSNRGRQKQNPYSSYYFVVYDHGFFFFCFWLWQCICHWVISHRAIHACTWHQNKWKHFDSLNTTFIDFWAECL